jgi:hypothetical protein
MKIAYNFNNRLIVQEVSELPTFEHVIIDNVDLSAFFNPIVLNGQIVESATPEEIATIKQSELLNELIDTCVLLTERSLISSVNKEGSEKFLQGQIERYKEKYKVAKQYVADQTINNQFWYDAIVIEMNNTNLIFNYSLDIPTFMAIIVQQFELGELRSQKFETAIEVFRCKTKDLIVANEFTRAEACLEYGKNIPDQMTIEDLETFLTEFNGL